MLCSRHRMMNDDGSCPYCRLAERQGCAADAQKKKIEGLQDELAALREAASRYLYDITASTENRRLLEALLEEKP